MNGDIVLFQRQGRVATLTLNRLEKRNALNPEMLDTVSTTLLSLREDPEVRCAVLRGAGEDAFSAGFDIGRIGQRQTEQGETPPRQTSPFARAREAIALFPYPVIAMIYGYCVGGGLELAVSCDMRIASDTARLGITPAKLGIVYSFDPVRLFVDLVGPAYTKELFCTGRLVDAQRAHIMGLVNQIVPAAELEGFTYALAQEIAENAPLSVKASKTMINRIVSVAPVTPEEEEDFAHMREIAAASHDLREGRQAFQEKRRPQFVGR